jgi:hypothetical protein
MGGLGGFGSLGGPGGLGGMGYHRASARRTPPSSFSSYTTNGAFWSYNFPGTIPETIPSVVIHRHGDPPPPGGHPHVPTSVAHTTAMTVFPLRSLPRGDISTLSASDLSLSGWPAPSADLTPPVVVAAIPPAPAPSSSSSSYTSLAPLDKPSLKTEPFKLSEIKDVKSYLDMQD